MRKFDRALASGVGVAVIAAVSVWMADRYGGAQYWPSFVGELAAGAILLTVGYVVIDRTLKLGQHRKEEKQRRDAALAALRLELEHNARGVWLQKRTLAKGRVGYPLFDLGALRLVFEPVIFSSLAASTADALVKVRARLDTANDLHALAFDLTHGRTSLLTEGARAAEQADKIRAGLLQRLTELEPRLYDAIDAVRVDLGVTGPAPAATEDWAPGKVGLVGFAEGELPDYADVPDRRNVEDATEESDSPTKE